jgi:hypothetical protein
MLSFVLGFIDASSATGGGVDLFDGVDTPSVVAWLDKYCAANPLDDFNAAALALRAELVARHRGRAAH